ncbi:hypothetical protein A3Q56_02510 [Intoshia linei]|uniref:Ion transport domain-containing protein n=1 Tax=Intoshia linei TaxID=1819745 RepID=A0A177B7S5_9BILA|nr:hypothetical protein A3Q56_02510 [Intoshia linei]
MLNSHSENSNLNSTHSNVRGYTKFVKYEGDESALTSMLQKNYKPDSHVFMLGRKPEIPTPFFTQGNFLPKRYGKLPKNLISQPLYEIDNYYTNTFIVISKNRTIYRFNKQKSFYLFSPHSIIRNVTVIRMFRVFRVLKTVSVVPGLKTIVRALIEACYGLKDVLILTVFMLSIFSLLGLQLYQGKLGQQCIKNFDNSTFVPDIPTFAPVSVELFCKHINSSRLITQDFWQDLYQKILRTNGYWHLFFFILIIFLGSFYLINLILAIVSLAYESEIKKSKCDELPEQIDAAGINPDRKRKTRKISKVTLNELVNIDDIPYIDENKSINEDDRIKKIKIKRTWQEIVKQTQEDRNKKKNILSRKRLAARRRNAVQFKPNEKSILFSRFFERHIENLSYKVNKNFPTLFFLIQSVEYYVTNPIFDVFMTFVIIANTIIMSLDRYEINEYDEYILNIGNMV